MEIRNLITFIHVAEQGSFTKAASRLGYSQSTVSFQIHQLEESLDCLLFERINHTVTLTDKGRELLDYAHRICALSDEAKESMAAHPALQGHIHVVTPDSVCEDMILHNYADFHRHYPDISLKFTTADTTDMFRMLDRNEADIILTLDSHVYDRDYVIAKEEPLSVHFVAGASSPLVGRRDLSLRDIAGEALVLTERGQGYRRVLDRELEKRSMELTPALEIGRTDVITRVVAESDMVAFLPDFVTQDMVAAGRLAYLDVADLQVEIWKQMIYHRNKWLSGCLRAFIEYVKQAEFGPEGRMK